MGSKYWVLSIRALVEATVCQLAPAARALFDIEHIHDAFISLGCLTGRVGRGAGVN